MPKLEFEISAESLAIIRDGQAALRWLDRDKTWEAWLRIGKAFVEVRNVAMERAGVNRPFGPRYRDLFGLLLRQFKFVDHIKDKGDRARLVEVMAILPEIEEWRNGLTPDERRRWNHPTTVWREYKKAQRKEMALPDDDVFRPPTLTERHRALQSEVHELRKGAPLPWGPHDSPADKARAVMEHLSIVEAEELALALLQAVKAAREPALEPPEASEEEDTGSGLKWTGDDEKGYSARTENGFYLVTSPKASRWWARFLKGSRLDTEVSLFELADECGEFLNVPGVAIVGTAAEAKAQCEADYAQQ